MQRRSLGKSGRRVSAIGLGCMGMSEFYGASDEAASIATYRAGARPRRGLPCPFCTGVISRSGISGM